MLVLSVLVVCVQKSVTNLNINIEMLEIVYGVHCQPLWVPLQGLLKLALKEVINNEQIFVRFWVILRKWVLLHSSF